MSVDAEANAMASPDGQKGCNHDETSSRDVTYHQSLDLIETPQTDYCETFHTQSVPTKTGDEVDHGAQHEEERPQTAGTSYSGNTNLDEEDANFLKTVTQHGTTKDTAGNSQLVTNTQPSFTGPPQTNNNESGQAFSFAPAIPQQLDMTGTRRGFASAMNSHTSATNEGERQIPHQIPVHGTRPLISEVCSNADVQAGENPGRPARSLEETSQMTFRHDNNSVRYGKASSHKSQTDARELEGIIQVNRMGLPNVKDQGEELKAPSKRLPASKRPKASLAKYHDAFFHMQPSGVTESTAFLQAELKTPGSNSLRPSSGGNEPRADTGARVTVDQSPPMEKHVDQCDDDPPISSRDGHQATSRKTATRRPRSKRSKMMPHVKNNGQNEQSASDIEDYLQVFGYKMHVKKQEAARKHAAEKGALLAELRHEVEAKSALQEELRTARADRTFLITSVEQQKTRVRTLEHKASRFRTFVDGLGNDMDALKKESGATRRRSERLIQEGEERKAEQHVLLEQLSDCAEKSAQLQSSALKACQETHSELKMAQQQNNYLEQQLHEKVGLLAEERDRRAQQEARSVSDAGSNQAVLSALKVNQESLLEQLYLLRTLIEDDENDKRSTDLVEKVLAAVQALTSQHSANADDLLSMSGNMQTLSNEVTNFIELASKGKSSGQPGVDSLRDHLDEALQRITDHFDLRKVIAEHAAGNEERTVVLQEKLKDIDMRLRERDLQKAADETAKEQLTDQIHRLQTRIESMQENDQSTATSDRDLVKARDELESKSRALDAANDKLLSIQQELRTLRETNDDLQEQKRSLLNGVAEAERRVATADAEKRTVEIKYKDDAEKLRTDASNHLQNALSKYKMQSENSLRTLTSQRDEATQKIKHLQGEVEASRASLVQFQQESTERTAEHARHLRLMEEQAETSQHEIESLRTRVAKQHEQTDDDEAVKQHISQLSEQLDLAKTKQRAALEQQGVLAAKVQSIQHDLMQTQCAKEEAEKRALQLSGEKSSQLRQLQNRVEELENDLEEAKTDLQHQRKIFQDKSASEELSHDGSVKALQLNIQETQVDNEHYKDRLVHAQAELEKVERMHNDRTVETVAQRNANDLDPQATTSETLADHQHLRPELIRLKQPFSQDSGLSQSPSVHTDRPSVHPPIGVVTTKDGITPSATDKEDQPPRPRKKVDRSTNTITDAGSLPVPELLRRPGSRVGESQKLEINRRKPVADTSQSCSGTIQIPSLLGSNVRSSGVDGKRPVTAAGSESDEMLDRTQATESLPLFSQFNAGNSLSQAQSAEPRSPAVDASPNENTAFPANALSNSYSPQGSRVNAANDTSTVHPGEIAIYEDSQQHDRSRREKAAESRGVLRDNLAWSQARSDKNMFRKEYPNPNSALKLVRHGDNGKPGSASADMEPKDKLLVPGRSASKFSKVEARIESAVYHPKSQRTPTANSAKSSSPDYVAETGARTQMTYRLESGPGSTKHGVYRSESKLPVDPRLVGRETRQVTKRKTSGSLLEGYESERKKRKTKESAPTPKRSQRRSSQRTVAPESFARNETPIPDTYSNRDNAGPTKPSRRRAQVYKATERRRGSKKNNEMTAYFKDTLGR
ncbi:hypothetical protein KC360_g2603 [Hortaea werneckii]|nr:hypothetical protein KC325_g1079 [Hortaea werneckii]KAI7001672.1 hypothetical protein KC359_g417 [Hortaea werneckii]KAI7150049.1 hypothetical protein KC344_g403 [Hortaea werneckii]KAI7177031.1 hypothetical protein KC360_g2603 [Hortaea werneckii]